MLRSIIVQRRVRPRWWLLMFGLVFIFGTIETFGGQPFEANVVASIGEGADGYQRVYTNLPAPSCDACHASAAGLSTALSQACKDSDGSACALNEYGLTVSQELRAQADFDWLAAFYKVAVENSRDTDSDGDNFTNHEEIIAGKSPALDGERPEISIAVQPVTNTPVYADRDDTTDLQVTLTNATGDAGKHIALFPALEVEDTVYPCSPANALPAGQTEVTCGVRFTQSGRAAVSVLGRTKTARDKGLGVGASGVAAVTVRPEVKVMGLTIAQTQDKQIANAGEEVTFSFDVTNSGDEALAVAAAPDAADNSLAGACADQINDDLTAALGATGLLGSGASETATCTFNVPDNQTGADLTGRLNITGVADPAVAAAQLSKSVDLRVRTVAAAVELQQGSTDLPETVAFGEFLEYTYTVVNTSADRADLAEVTVTNQSGSCSLTLAQLAHSTPTAPQTCRVRVIGVEPENTFVDILTVSGTVPGTAVRVSDFIETSVRVVDREPKLDLDVEQVAERFDRDAGTVSIDYRVLVANQGNVVMEPIRVTASIAAACARQFGLAPAASEEYMCTLELADLGRSFRNGRFVFPHHLVAETEDPFVNPCAGCREDLLVDAASLGHVVRLPFVSHVYGAPPPDLIVDSMSVTADGVLVSIQNIGPGTVPAGTAFWVDLYLNPAAAPVRVNQIARDFDGDGLVWGVVLAEDLRRTDKLRLTLDSESFDEDAGRFPGASLPAGARIYAQVDSAARDSRHGAVLEFHERFGGPYNNILMTELSAAVDPSAWPTLAGAAATTPESLPARPFVRR